MGLLVRQNNSGQGYFEGRRTLGLLVGQNHIGEGYFEGRRTFPRISSPRAAPEDILAEGRSRGYPRRGPLPRICSPRRAEALWGICFRKAVRRWEDIREDADGHRHVSLVSPGRLLAVVVVCFVCVWAGASGEHAWVGASWEYAWVGASGEHAYPPSLTPALRVVAP